MEEILDYLWSIYQFPEECRNYLKSVVERKDVKKGQLILQAGEVCQQLYFIKKGLLRCYYLLGVKEITDWFFWEGGTVVSIPSWYTQTPGDDYIQALEDCELYFISYKNLEYVYKNFPEFNYIGRELTIKYLMIWHSLARNTRMLTDMERYQLILKHQPEVLRRVPVGYLATWLGMTPETLSRIRGKI